MREACMRMWMRYSLCSRFRCQRLDLVSQPIGERRVAYLMRSYEPRLTRMRSGKQSIARL